MRYLLSIILWLWASCAPAWAFPPGFIGSVTQTGSVVAVTLAEQTLSDGSRNLYLTGSSEGYFVGQSFTPSQTKSLKELQIYIVSNPNTSATVRCRIGTSSNLTSGYLEELTGTAITSTGWKAVQSATHPTLSSGTTYYFGCLQDGGIASNNTYGIYDSSDNYSGGIYYYADTPYNLTGNVGTRDLTFRVIGQ